jgi:hypothetical protein
VIHSIFLKLGLTWEEAVHRRVKAVILYLAENDGGHRESGSDPEMRTPERAATRSTAGRRAPPPDPDRGERLGGSRARAVLDDLEDEHPPSSWTVIAAVTPSPPARAPRRSSGTPSRRLRREWRPPRPEPVWGRRRRRSGAQCRAQPARLEQGRMDPQGEAPSAFRASCRSRLIPSRRATAPAGSRRPACGHAAG